MAHYLLMAYGKLARRPPRSQGSEPEKYLYVFRPLLACRWIEGQLGQVSMLLAQLLEGVLPELVARDQAGYQLAVAPPVEALTRFIEIGLPRLEALNEPDDADGEVEDPIRQAQGPEPIEGLNGFTCRYALAA